MQFSILPLALLASAALAAPTAEVDTRAPQVDFAICSQENGMGVCYWDSQPPNSGCWNLNGKGDHAHSIIERGGVRGERHFFRERDCNGPVWDSVGPADTVPDFLKDHIYSYFV